MMLSFVCIARINYDSERNQNAGIENFVYVGEYCVIRAWPKIFKKWAKPKPGVRIA